MVFAALADLSGLGRRLIPEIAEALKEEGLLEKETQFENVDQLLDSMRKPHHAGPDDQCAAHLMSPPSQGVDGNSIAGAWTQGGSDPSLCQGHKQPMGRTEGRGGKTGTLDIR